MWGFGSPGEVSSKYTVFRSHQPCDTMPERVDEVGRRPFHLRRERSRDSRRTPMAFAVLVIAIVAIVLIALLMMTG
jgi:hypothetical protein